MTRIDSEPPLISDRDAQLAREASRALDGSAVGQRLKMQIVEAGEPCPAIELPAAATTLLKTLLKEMAAGRPVTIVPVEAEITTQQAAEILHVSRPFVVALIDNGTLPARMVGSHRRLQLHDVLSYKRASKTKAHKALKEMVAISQDLGLE